MKNIVIGMLAHVDAGKTTLSEGLLYTGNVIRRLGRVDNKDAFLDTDKLERLRGITIFAKQAVIKTENTYFTLLDTPGHVDFSAEMERTLAVLDYAVLVISAADGVQSHTRTVWKLLDQYHIPTFIFVNKMDMNGTDRDMLMENLQKELSGSCIDFDEEADIVNENLAMCDEHCMDEYLKDGNIGESTIANAVKHRMVFPCVFGSALKLNNVDRLLSLMDEYTVMPESGRDEFGARVYKISRDAQDNRLTYLKVTSGELKVRRVIGDDKAAQLRIYSGDRYETCDTVYQGMVCAVLGLNGTYPGEGLGCEYGNIHAVLEPVLDYRIKPVDDITPAKLLLSLRELEEEEPQLSIVWNEELGELHVKLMGEVQTEVLKSVIKDRYDVNVEFDEGSVVYKETVAGKTEGVGHFEPLRHYAEVHILIEPGERGSGITITTQCREDILDRNWQRLIMTHLAEREHKGVLTGSALTDVKFTILTGRAHQKHTEGGDFRQAVYRAVRQGLMKADNVLLEPYYSFSLELPQSFLGRAMTDVERMSGHCGSTVLSDGKAVLTGRAPVVGMRHYQKEVNAYTRGEGHLTLFADGYDVCHNAEEVIERRGYIAEADTANPAASVFCAHGAGFIVPWDEVEAYMHLEAVLLDDGSLRGLNDEELKLINPLAARNDSDNKDDDYYALGTDEIDEIIARTSHANSHDKGAVKQWKRSAGSKAVVYDYGTSSGKNKPEPKKEKYLLVDGYNVVFAWDELKDIAAVNIDGARGRLLDILCNYQGIKKINLIAVFDAYRVPGHKTEYLDYHNIHVVYTREAETADRYIERFAHENASKYDVTVVTSDGLEQIIIRGQGCQLMSSRDFEKEVASARQNLAEAYSAANRPEKNYIGDHEIFKNGIFSEDKKTGR